MGHKRLSFPFATNNFAEINHISTNPSIQTTDRPGYVPASTPGCTISRDLARDPVRHISGLFLKGLCCILVTFLVCYSVKGAGEVGRENILEQLKERRKEEQEAASPARGLIHVFVPDSRVSEAKLCDSCSL